jgi:hypothetical protein
MTDTPNLVLPYIEAAQAQKHVTHNEAIRALDALVHLTVVDRDLAAPPGSPVDGARYIVAASPTGAWAGQAGKIAAFQDGAWAFYTPREGWVTFIADEDALVVFNGTAWVAAGGSVNPTPLVGVNATADTTNRLAVSSPAVLLNHEGAGHQLKVNKNAATDTASLLFQTGFSGRAEMGTPGSDDFKFKVSSNGSTWHDAIVIDRTSGAVTMPNTSGGGSGPPMPVLSMANMKGGPTGVGAALVSVAAVAGRLYLTRLVGPRGGATLVELGIRVNTASAAGTKARLGLYAERSSSDPLPGALILDAGEVLTDAAAYVAATISQAITAGTPYWLAVNFQSTPTVMNVPGAGAGAPLGYLNTGGAIATILRVLAYGPMPADESAQTYLNNFNAPAVFWQKA